MHETQTSTDLESLARLTPAIRALARSIVRDAHLAEDVVQDALATAGERGVAGARDPRRWLFGVVRNLALRAVRRRSTQVHAERAASRRDGTESTADVVARTETHRRLVATVLELPEPYRATVLLRYFDDLTTRTIAARHGVTESTVRARLSRGHELLRGRLDRQERGRRAAWIVALAPLLQPPPHGSSLPSRAATTGAPGVLLMASKSKLTAAAVILLALLGGLAWYAEPAPPTLIRPPASDGPPSATAARIRARRAAVDVASHDATAPAASAERESTETVRVSGRVIDPQRNPAAGLPVELRDGAGRVTRGVTGADGRFTIPVDLAAARGITRILACAFDELGRAAHGSTPVPESCPTDLALGTLRLDDAFSVSVHVVDKDGLPAADVRVVCREHDATPLASLRTDAAGVAHFDLLPRADVVFRAYAPGRGRAVSRLMTTNRHGAAVDLRLTGRSIRVTVRREDGGAVAGVRLFGERAVGDSALGHLTKYDPPLVSPPTDERGVTTLRDVEVGDPLRIRALAAGEVALDGAQGTPVFLAPRGVVIDAGESDAELVLPDVASWSWTVDAGQSAPPVDGTPLTLRAHADHRSIPARITEARITDGRVVVTAWADANARFEVFAFLPDGRWARLDSRGQRDPVRFSRGRDLRVRVLDHDGVPVANTSGRVVVSHEGRREVVTTDADGVFAISALPDHALRLSIDLPAPPLWGGLHMPRNAWVRRFTVEPDVTSVEVRLERPLELTLQLRVDGAPAIPPTLHRVISSWGPVFDAREDPVTGRVTVKLHRRAFDHPLDRERGRSLEIRATARGFVDAVTRVDTADVTDGATVELAFATGAEFRARVLRRRRLGLRLALERWSEERHCWDDLHVHTITGNIAMDGPVADADGDVSVTGLPAGRYCLRDRRTGRSSDPVDLVPGETSPVVVLDTTDRAHVQGRIEFPPGVPRDGRARIVVEGPDATRADDLRGLEDGIAVRADGGFSVTVPRETPVVLRVEHPVHAPAPDGGRIEVQGDARDVVLRLVRTADAR